MNYRVDKSKFGSPGIAAFLLQYWHLPNIVVSACLSLISQSRKNISLCDSSIVGKMDNLPSTLS